jgi:hypothetical protein
MLLRRQGASTGATLLENGVVGNLPIYSSRAGSNLPKPKFAGV